ncbi:hypothetical protein B0I35DRAFT_413629 [Stachybotrys elegans]|uniref:LysM domain-containing protein n=1 Tax=Stachybotrys elegans TaxID=80388 RepID=A0A8K0SJH7_9HYPO|nr:hypothetical protein B0I35DRAFT_413629 [Stachybotrys elegans]
MKGSTTLVLALASAHLTVASRGTKRQTGPVDSSTTPYCTYFDTVYSKYDDCAYFEDFWGISHQDFISWLFQWTCEGTKPTATTTAGNGIATPTPTQLGMVGNCDRFSLVAEGDTCQKIAARSGISETQLRTWNPSLGSNCKGLWLNAYTCVRTIGFVPPFNVSCSTTSKTWGDNQPAALDSVGLWCNGDSTADGSGDLTTAQIKYGCYNAPFGQNKMEFWIRNDFGIGTSLSVQRCNDIAKLAVNQCQRGGDGTVESWYFKATVTTGRC